MPYLMVFVCGVVAGRSWDAVRTAVSPFVAGASTRFDTLYARTARTLARTLEDAEDRRAERRLLAAGEGLPN